MVPGKLRSKLRKIYRELVNISSDAGGSSHRTPPPPPLMTAVLHSTTCVRQDRFWTASGASPCRSYALACREYVEDSIFQDGLEGSKHPWGMVAPCTRQYMTYSVYIVIMTHFVYNIHILLRNFPGTSPAKKMGLGRRGRSAV